MKRTTISLLVGSMLGISTAQAQEKAVDLGELEIVEQSSEQATGSVGEAYESFDPIDSGASVIGEAAIEMSKGGGINTTDLLKTLPFVQMDNSQRDASAENIQSIRPQDFSISGGNFYDNNIKIDGISATSLHDVTEPSGDLDWENVYGQTSQTLYVSPDLLGSIEVLDSNISAEHGDFIGGVVNFELRKPKREFGFSASTSFQNDNMVRYHKPDLEDEDEAAEPPPNFHKQQTSFSVDLPLTDKLFVLGSYSRSESSVQYQENEEYGGLTHDNGDVSENYLIKVLYEPRENLTLEAQFVHSPYESERDLPNAKDDLMVSHSSGTQGYVAASGYTDSTEWSSKFAISDNDSRRESANVRFQWDGDGLDWCDTSKNCFEGGLGNLNQSQRDYTWTNRFSTALDNGTLNYGSELRYSEAVKSRPEDVYYYLSSKVADSAFVCAPNDISCTEGMAASKYYHYHAYTAEVGVYSHALWAEYLTYLGPVELRLGSRYSFDDFLKNHNIAPRLSMAWEFLPERHLTLGLNRYYSASMLGYAIREQEPKLDCYERDLKDDNGDWGGEVGEWTDCRFAPSSNSYASSDLKTPYSDELSAAITWPTALNGTLRVKGVYRQDRDEFARSEELTDANGNEYYEMTNDGESDYVGYSLEWSSAFERHFFNANITWSETRYNGASSYNDTPEDEAELIYYNGQIISMNEFNDINRRDNFAAPIRASLSLASSWLDGDLSTHASLHYTAKYEYLGDTLKNYTDENGTRYDIYGEKTHASVTSIDFNAKYRLLNEEKQRAFVELRVKNLFDHVNGDSTDYQMGRSYWLGLSYQM